jgi:acetyltransferase
MPENLVIRDWRAGDAERIGAVAPRISPHSLYQRHLVGTSRLPPPYLRMLRANDPPRSTTWLAHLAVLDGTVAGWSEHQRLPSGEAEFAILVVDEFQRRGIGLRLARAALARCRADGIGTVRAVVLPENLAVRALLRYADDREWCVTTHFADGLQHVRLRTRDVPPR